MHSAPSTAPAQCAQPKLCTARLSLCPWLGGEHACSRSTRHGRYPSQSASMRSMPGRRCRMPPAAPSAGSRPRQRSSAVLRPRPARLRQPPCRPSAAPAARPAAPAHTVAQRCDLHNSQHCIMQGAWPVHVTVAVWVPDTAPEYLVLWRIAWTVMWALSMRIVQMSAVRFTAALLGKNMWRRKHTPRISHPVGPGAPPAAPRAAAAALRDPAVAPRVPARP